jgi:hypothetical protein
MPRRASIDAAFGNAGDLGAFLLDTPDEELENSLKEA